MRFDILLVAILLPTLAYGATTLGPDDFEQIWLLNNQRNLIKRYQQRTEQYLEEQQDSYSLDIDATANQNINTSAGVKDAILDRMGLHYQSEHTLFLIDWLSLIPQPQTTEGFTYGDTVLGYSWQQNEDLRLTLGARLQSTPRTVDIAGTTVFNFSDNATRDQLGGFAHINYLGWDFGSYYSSQTGNQANSIYFPFIKTDNHRLSSALTYLAGASDLGISPRYELSLDDSYRLPDSLIQSGLTIASLTSPSTTSLSNAYLLYDSSLGGGLHTSAGLFYTYLPDSDETLPGAKLGISYVMQVQGEFSMALFVRQNAFGDINALVVKNEPVFSFNISARPVF